MPMHNKTKVVMAAFAALTVLSFAEPAQRQKLGRDKGKYVLVFRDEFNLPDGSQPDTAIWNRAPRANNMWAKWNSDSKKVAFIRKGKLVCRAIPNTNPNDTARMLTGAVFTKYKFAFQYGRIEVKMRTNLRKGNFPAAWLMVKNPGNPYRYGEMDLIEYFGDEGIARQTMHSHRTAILKKNDQKTVFMTKSIDRGQWHVYGLEWTPQALTTFIDGKVTGCYPKSDDPVKLQEGQWSFDGSFFLILNQSLGYGNWHEPDYGATYETEFDWVRIYQKKKNVTFY